MGLVKKILISIGGGILISIILSLITTGQLILNINTIIGISIIIGFFIRKAKI